MVWINKSITLLGKTRTVRLPTIVKITNPEKIYVVHQQDRYPVITPTNAINWTNYDESVEFKSYDRAAHSTDADFKMTNMDKTMLVVQSLNNIAAERLSKYNWASEEYANSRNNTSSTKPSGITNYTKLSGRTVYVDENIAGLEADLLKAGYNAKALPRNEGYPDAKIMEQASKENAIILTNNYTDFNKSNIDVIDIKQKVFNNRNFVVNQLDKISIMNSGNSTLPVNYSITQGGVVPKGQ